MLLRLDSFRNNCTISSGEKTRRGAQANGGQQQDSAGDDWLFGGKRRGRAEGGIAEGRHLKRSGGLMCAVRYFNGPRVVGPD